MLILAAKESTGLCRCDPVAGSPHSEDLKEAELNPCVSRRAAGAAVLGKEGTEGSSASCSLEINELQRI